MKRLYRKLKLKLIGIQYWFHRWFEKRQLLKEERNFRRKRRETQRHFEALPKELQDLFRDGLEYRARTTLRPYLRTEPNEPPPDWDQIKVKAFDLTDEELRKSGVAHMMRPSN